MLSVCHKSDYLQCIWDCLSMLHRFEGVLIHHYSSDDLAKAPLS